MLSFLKEQWNLLLNLSLAIVVLLTKVVVPPNIDLNAAVGSVDKTALARFVVIIALLAALLPFSMLKQKKHAVFWWILALVFLLAGVTFYVSYIGFTERKTGYNEFSMKRQVIGDHLYRRVALSLDSIKAAEKLDTITADDIVGKLGAPTENYPPQEVTHNADKLVILFTVTILFAALFIACSIQAAYCYRTIKKT